MRCTISTRCSTASRASRSSRRSRGARPGPAVAAAVDVHLQASRHRRRSGLASGRDLPAYDARHRDRLLDRARRRRSRQWLPAGPAGRASRPVAQALPPVGRAMVTDELDATPWPAVEPVPIEVRRGSLVVLHGLLPHGSSANRSSRPRHAYTLHLIDGRASYDAGQLAAKARPAAARISRDSQGRTSLPSRRLHPARAGARACGAQRPRAARPTCSAPTATMSGATS